MYEHFKIVEDMNRGKYRKSGLFLPIIYIIYTHLVYKIHVFRKCQLFISIFLASNHII